MKARILAMVLFLCATGLGYAQLINRYTYHDEQKNHVKEIYQVKDSIRNILQGRYISYYLNGSVESKGQFDNNETTGIWEFFYETGNLKMRGILKQNSNYGIWEYFYESGQKSMEGSINGKNREGEWKMYYESGAVREVGSYKNNLRSGLWLTYFEDGAIKAETEYLEDHGRYIEYDREGRILAEGPKAGARQVGLWRYYALDGTLQSEGVYMNGKKNGLWVSYYPNGNKQVKGSYHNDVPHGSWEYYFDDGTLSQQGEFVNGKKEGEWKTFDKDGHVLSQSTFVNNTGTYREYYASGALKTKGTIANNKKEGRWEYYYEDGKKEGECEFVNGSGLYKGYHPSGAIKTKGQIEEDRKVGTWELYENDGKLAGYYKPFYDEKQSGKEIVKMADRYSSRSYRSQARGFNYFDARSNEFRGVIVGGNPVMMFAGRFPVAVEFYLQERLGHEFEFVGIRDPFFKADDDIPVGKQFTRGSSIAIKQKFYNPMRVGMWYFGHELRFTNVGHFTNVPINPFITDTFTATSTEQRIEYGVILGYRIMKKNNDKGFTIDTFCSLDAGYRGFDVDATYASYFSDINQKKLATTFHFGLNFGNVFSFR